MYIKKIMFFLAALTFFSCTQGEGDRCERRDDADCEDGMICCIPANQNEGTCRNPEDCDDL